MNKVNWFIWYRNLKSRRSRACAKIKSSVVRGRDKEKREREKTREEKKKERERESREISGWWTGYETEAYEVSIPPKYGRVYTRINGRVSCKAITFPFLHFRCAHEGKGASLQIYESKEKGDKHEYERERGGRGEAEIRIEREIRRDERKILQDHMGT